MFVGAVGANLRNHLGSVHATFRMAADTAGAGQVFTRERNGYSEPNSARFPLEPHGRMRSQVVMLHPDGPLRAIRLDPGTGEGLVQLESIEVSWRSKRVRLTGAALREAARPLHDLETVPDQRGVSFRSTGGDPYLEIALPDDFANAMGSRASWGLALVVLAIAGLLSLTLCLRRGLVAFARDALRAGDWRLLILSMFATLLLLSLVGYGCNGMCSPRGAGFGSLLMGASLGLVAVGQVVLRGLGVEEPNARPRLFLSLLAGQAVCALYIAVRSAIHAWVPALPVTAPEMVGMVAASTAVLYRQVRANGNAELTGPDRRCDTGWLMIELAMLAAICLVIADRELPRMLMLSSDPDTHAYFARRVELDGGVPWHGESAFLYPMGTGILGFLWAKLAFLDVRNALTALPMLQAFLGALVMAEAFALRVRDRGPAILLFLAGLGATAAGFLIPVYSEYAHMEGAGRQLATATLALVPAVLTASRKVRDLPLAMLMLLSLFVLGILNPINLVVPLAMLMAFGLHQSLAERRIGWWILVPAALVPLLFLDPLYSRLMTGMGMPPSRFTVDPALHAQPLALVLERWSQGLKRGPWEFLAGNAGFLPAQSPLFIIYVALLAPVLLWVSRRAPRLPSAAALLAVLAVLWATDALFDALADDRRFYLLAPYFWLSLAQAKILLTTTLLLAVALWIHRLRRSAMSLAVFSTLAIAAVSLTLHRTQGFMSAPRVDYCGSLGCIEPDDLRVLSDFEALYLEGKLRRGRVLLPNSTHHAAHEEWIFPVTAARALPFFDTPPAAFFYYQGDADFTTANYLAYVCRSFNRDWLRGQGIAYVFLPGRRSDACVQGIETLPYSERLIAQHGNSIVVELR